MIRTVVETGSTNADLLAEAAMGISEGAWLRAERQTSGRGRLGREWRSPAGNLHASTVIRLLPGDPPPASLALVAGVALHEAASAWAGAGLRLKWPNDLLHGTAKLAGILLERSGNVVVAGFGVNLAAAPAMADRPVCAVAQLTGTAPDPGAFLDDLAASMIRALRMWRGRGVAAIRFTWLDAAHPIGTPLAATAGGRRLEGLFDGLDSDGNLTLRLATGEIVRINAGDVFLI